MAKEATEKEFDMTLAEKILQLRNDGAKWEEVTGQTGVPSGKAMQLYAIASLPKKEYIKNATGADIVRLRDDSVISWGQIVARVRYPESRCRLMYEEAKGETTKGNRIGKGGRHPGDPNAEPREPKVKGEKAAKVTTPKPPKRSPIAESLDEMPEDELREFLTGRGVKISLGAGDEETIKIKAVKAVKKGSITVTDADTNKARAFKIATIMQVTKSVVVKN